MKPIYKSVKVIHNIHERSFDVYYKTFMRWKFDRSYYYDENSPSVIYTNHFINSERAKALACERAENMLKSTEVMKKSSVLGWS